MYILTGVNYYIKQSNAPNPPNLANVFKPNLVPSIPDPSNNLNSFNNHLISNHGTHQIKQVAPPSVNGEKLMSPFLEAPKPPRPQSQPRIPSVQWANPNGFIPSQLTNR